MEGVTSEAALVSKSSEVGDVSQVDTSKGFESDTKAVIGSADVGFPLWYYDSLRSIYWYYDKETRAYYKYNEEAQNGWAETTVLAESTANADRSQQEQILMEGTFEIGDGEYVIYSSKLYQISFSAQSRIPVMSCVNVNQFQTTACF